MNLLNRRNTTKGGAKGRVLRPLHIAITRLDGVKRNWIRKTARIQSGISRQTDSYNGTESGIRMSGNLNLVFYIVADLLDGDASGSRISVDVL